VIQDKSGNLYGTTVGGGIHDKGRVFKLAPSGGQAGLTGENGTDGASNSESVATGHGWVFSVLHSFADSPDGSLPFYGSSLTFDNVGNLYGVTWGGGTSQHGTVYEITH
jgi:uncharacterized repeat protein (TIGR03803 family)